MNKRPILAPLRPVQFLGSRVGRYGDRRNLGRFCQSVYVLEFCQVGSFGSHLTRDSDFGDSIFDIHSDYKCAIQLQTIINERIIVLEPIYQISNMRRNPAFEKQFKKAIDEGLWFISVNNEWYGPFEMLDQFIINPRADFYPENWTMGYPENRRDRLVSVTNEQIKLAWESNYSDKGMISFLESLSAYKDFRLREKREQSRRVDYLTRRGEESRTIKFGVFTTLFVCLVVILLLIGKAGKDTPLINWGLGLAGLVCYWLSRKYSKRR